MERALTVLAAQALSALAASGGLLGPSSEPRRRAVHSCLLVHAAGGCLAALHALLTRRGALELPMALDEVNTQPAGRAHFEDGLGRPSLDRLERFLEVRSVRSSIRAQLRRTNASLAWLGGALLVLSLCNFGLELRRTLGSDPPLLTPIELAELNAPQPIEAYFGDLPLQPRGHSRVVLLVVSASAAMRSRRSRRCAGCWPRQVQARRLARSAGGAAFDVDVAVDRVGGCERGAHRRLRRRPSLRSTPSSARLGCMASLLRDRLAVVYRALPRSCSAAALLCRGRRAADVWHLSGWPRRHPTSAAVATASWRATRPTGSTCSYCTGRLLRQPTARRAVGGEGEAAAAARRSVGGAGSADDYDAATQLSIHAADADGGGFPATKRSLMLSRRAKAVLAAGGPPSSGPGGALFPGTFDQVEGGGGGGGSGGGGHEAHLLEDPRMPSHALEPQGGADAEPHRHLFELLVGQLSEADVQSHCSGASPSIDRRGAYVESLSQAAARIEELVRELDATTTLLIASDHGRWMPVARGSEPTSVDVPLIAYRAGRSWG